MFLHADRPLHEIKKKNHGETLKERRYHKFPMMVFTLFFNAKYPIFRPRAR